MAGVDERKEKHMLFKLNQKSRRAHNGSLQAGHAVEVWRVAGTLEKYGVISGQRVDFGFWLLMGKGARKRANKLILLNENSEKQTHSAM